MTDRERWMMLWRALRGTAALCAAGLVIADVRGRRLISTRVTQHEPSNVPLLWTVARHQWGIHVLADTLFKIQTLTEAQCVRVKTGWQVGDATVGRFHELHHAVIAHMQMLARSELDKAQMLLMAAEETNT